MNAVDIVNVEVDVDVSEIVDFYEVVEEAVEAVC